MASEVDVNEPFKERHSSSPPIPTSHVKTWLELRQAVWQTRKLATSLLNRVPHSFTFRQLGHGQTRLYFLGVTGGQRENTLQYTDVPETHPFELPAWLPLVEPAAGNVSSNSFSKEEQLLRERKRLGSFGVTSYDYSERDGKFVFSAANGLFHCMDSVESGSSSDSYCAPPLVAHELRTSCSSSRLDAKLCPANSNLVAYISASDLWITHTDSGHECRLTYARKGGMPISQDPVSAGVPSFVVQEEFDRYTGYWWQPQADDTGRYCILYEVVDESEVDVLHLAAPAGEATDIDEYRYPRSGSYNAVCTLKLVTFSLTSSHEICDVTHHSLVEELTHTFPWLEYIPRAGWSRDGSYVYISLLSRSQQRLQLALIPKENFVPQESSDVHISGDLSMEMSNGETPSLPVYVIYEETSHIWINVHDVLCFLPATSPHEVTFLWASQKCGYRHLYRVTAAVGGVLHTDLSCSHILSEVALTSGEWEIIGKQVWVDEQHERVYFMGLKDTPIETHLYTVSYTSPGVVTRLTQPGFSHQISFDKECSLFVSVFSSLSQPSASTLWRVVHNQSGTTQPGTICLGELSPAMTGIETRLCPQLLRYRSESCGQEMFALVYRPHNYEPGHIYPTVLFVYGGPQVQLVTNSYKSMRFLRLHTLASLGYAVVVIDSRGSCNRGLQFESHLQARLGQVEIADQVEGLQWLAQSVGFLDLQRVAIHGWSYGGYLALLGLCQRPDIFKVAVAGAPVTSWAYYDTGYTERYMGLPADNPDAYRQASVLEQVKNFPAEGNRLLLVHGLIDENVHFVHTSQLINALVKACKPYQLQLYPNERHGIRNPEANEHYETNILNFLQQNL